MPKTKPQAAVVGGSADDIETAFYEALQTGDIEKLMACWADEDEVVCVHPGGPRVVGALAIRAAFDAMFSNGTIRAVWPSPPTGSRPRSESGHFRRLAKPQRFLRPNPDPRRVHPKVRLTKALPPQNAQPRPRHHLRRDVIRIAHQRRPRDPRNPPFGR